MKIFYLEIPYYKVEYIFEYSDIKKIEFRTRSLQKSMSYKLYL